MKILVLSHQGRSKSMHQILRARRRKQVVSRIFNQLLWQMGSSCFTDGGRFREFRTPSIHGILKKKNNTQSTAMWSIATSTCCTGLFISRISSVSTEQSQGGAEQILKRQGKSKQTLKCSQNITKNSNQKIGSQVIVDSPRQPHASWNRMLQKFERFQFDVIYEQNWTSPYNGDILPSDRERKLLCYNNSGWWRMAKAHVNVQRIHSAQKQGGFKAIRINWCRPRNWSSLKYWDCYGYWCSWYWSASAITEFSRILRTDFDKSSSRKICERNSQQWQQRQRQQSYVNTSESKVLLYKERDPQGGQNLDYNSWMPEIQKGFRWNSLSKCVTNVVRHHDQDVREADGAMHWDVKLPVSKGRFQNQLEKAFTDEDSLHCLYLGSIKTRFAICKDENGELRHIRALQCHSGGMIISPRLMNYVTTPYKWKRVIYHVGRARDQYSISEAGLVAGGKERKEEKQTIYSSSSFQQRCTRSRTNYRYQETKKSTLSKSLETWTRCSVLDSLVHSTRCWTRILADRFSCHYYIPVCAKRMRRKGCQRKWKERIVRKAAHTSRTTKSNTQTIMGSWEIPECKHASGNRE